MKPSKNKYYCQDCRRSKMLFKSQEEADAFIAHNGNDVFRHSGKRLTRSYFCSACGGWHLTSSKTDPFKSQFEMSLEKEAATIIKAEQEPVERMYLFSPEESDDNIRHLTSLFVDMEREVWLSQARTQESIRKFVDALNGFRHAWMTKDNAFKRRLNKRLKSFADRFVMDLELYVKIVHPDSAAGYKAYFDNKLRHLNCDAWTTRNRLQEAFDRIIKDYRFFLSKLKGEEDFKKKLGNLILKRARKLGLEIKDKLNEN